MPLTPTGDRDRRAQVSANPLLGRGGELLSVPRDALPDGELEPAVAAQMIRETSTLRTGFHH